MSQQEQEKKKTAKRIHAPKGPAAIERTKRRKQIRLTNRTERLAKLMEAKAGREKPSNLFKDRVGGFRVAKLQGKYLELANLVNLHKAEGIAFCGPEACRIKDALELTLHTLWGRKIPVPVTVEEECHDQAG